MIGLVSQTREFHERSLVILAKQSVFWFKIRGIKKRKNAFLNAKTFQES